MTRGTAAYFRAHWFCRPTHLPEYLREEDWPVTTEIVAKRIKASWNTAQVHLYKLLAEGKVKGKRVGRQNQWALK